MNKRLSFSSLALMTLLFLGTMPLFTLKARGGRVSSGSKTGGIRRAGGSKAKLVKVTKDSSQRGGVTYTGAYNDGRNLECTKGLGRGGGYSCSFNNTYIEEVPGTNTGQYYFDFLEKKFAEQEKTKK